MKAAKYLVIIFIFLGFQKSHSQFIVDAQLRPRFEFRHGYKTLFPDDVDPAAFVSQRTRLNFTFKTEKLTFFISTQDVRVWGDVTQTNAADKNGFSLHQAWAQLPFAQDFSIKIGRQELVYDDQRFLGNVDWAQQGRSHDAAVIKYEPASIKMHLGVAYNQDGEALTGNTLTVDTYKSLQYLWMHKDWEKISGSFLFLNNGLQYIDELDSSKNETRYSQTAGMYLTANLNNFRINSNLYYQFGRDVLDNSLSAYLVSLEAKYLTGNLNLGLGGELISGNELGIPNDGKNNAFNPLYGTNHKFNGFIDYFYVGNHYNSLGLLDLQGNITYSFNKRANINATVHQFFAAKPLNYDVSKDLGFELDLVTSLILNEYAGLQVGYSQFFATRGTEALKNNFDGNINNFAWAMLTIDPVLFTWDKTNEINVN